MKITHDNVPQPPRFVPKTFTITIETQEEAATLREVIAAAYWETSGTTEEMASDLLAAFDRMTEE